MEEAGIKSQTLTDMDYFYHSNNIVENPKKVLMLIQDKGYLGPGDLSREAMIYHSKDKGSMMPIIREALKHKFKILVLNHNKNTRYDPRDFELETISGIAVEHAIRVWDFVMEEYKGASIMIVAHRGGCELVHELDQRRNVSIMANKIVFIDSMNFVSEIALDPFRKVTHRYEQICPPKEVDEKCMSFGSHEPELMPYAALKHIFSYLVGPPVKQRSKTLPLSNDSGMYSRM